MLALSLIHISAMHVNNEVGSILDVAALAKAVKEKNSRTAVHIDGVQAWGKVPQRLNGTAIDSYAVDVYKRQGGKCAAPYRARRRAAARVGRYGGHPVSYTHLDVYKRQLRHWIPHKNML